MKIIGITGTSGAGKTTISGILNSSYGAYIINADKVAKRLSKKGNKYLESIVNEFGKDIIDENGELRRKKLANIIYDDMDKRNRLNKITFNYVVKKIREELDTIKNENLVVIDAPLLFESNLDKICDIVIGVIAKDEDKIIRICNRDNIAYETAKKRISIQMDNETLKEKANYIIYNDYSIEKLENEIRNIMNT